MPRKAFSASYKILTTLRKRRVPHASVLADASSGAVSDLEVRLAESLSDNARAGNTSISGRGTGRYIRFDPWSWQSLQRAQA